MVYDIYTLYTDRKLNLFAEKNKARAIQKARQFAVEEKESTIVYAGLYKKTPVAICEFPNYLRNLNLTTSDITVNKL